MSTIYRKVQSWYGRRFFQYGHFVGRYPVVFIIAPIAIFGLLGLGIIKIEYETDVKTLYTPINSQAAQDTTLMSTLFPDRTGDNYNIFSLNDEDRYGEVIILSQGDIFSPTVIKDIRTLVDKIRNITVEDQQYTYEDVCARVDGECVVSGDFFLSDTFLSEVQAGNVTYPVWEHRDISFSIASVNRTDDILKSAKVLKLTFHLRQDNSTFYDRSLLWEDAFIDSMASLSKNVSNSGVSYATSQSLGDELNENTDGDVGRFSLSFTLLTTYASFVSGGDCVSSRSHVTRAGVMAAGFGILGSIGFMSLLGIKFVNICGIMPFLVLSIGVDDMFLLVSGWADTNQHGAEWSVPKRLGHTFRLVGVGITITSLTDVVAFCVGYSSVFLSIRNFCMYTGTAIIFSYICQVTFLSGCLAVHGRRVESSKHCITCKRINSEKENSDKPWLFRCLCSGEPPRHRQDSILERLPPLFLQKVLLTPIGKVCVIVGFLAYLCCSVWGLTKVKQGLFLENLVPPFSYYANYSVQNYDHFGTRIPVSFVIKESVDYYGDNATNSLEHLLYVVGSETFMKNTTSRCSILEYLSSDFANKTTRRDFILGFKTFLEVNKDFQNDAVIDTTSLEITSLRCHMLSENVPDSSDQADLMLRLREITSNSSLPVFPFHPLFVYFEQYVSVLPTVVQTLGIAVLVVVLLTALFLPHPLIVILVCFNITVILIGVFGFMGLWDLSISAITMIHLVMSVGFSVDFTVHVATAYMLAEGDTRNERVKNTIVHAAGPIFNGGFSTFLGISTLITSQSYVFLSFFKIMLLVILFGVSSAVFLLPVVLSLIGPHVTVNTGTVLRPPTITVFTTVSVLQHQFGYREPVQGIENGARP